MMKRRAAWLIVAAILVVALVARMKRAERVPEPSARAAANAAPAANDTPDEARARATPEPRAVALPRAAPSAKPESEEEHFRARMAETRAVLLEKTRYPMSSRPLAGKTDLLLPHHAEPIFRGLGPNGPGRIRITQTQDRVFISPGEPAEVTITATSSDGAPVSLEFVRSDLVKQTDGRPDGVLGHAAFHTGNIPGLWTATVATPADGNPTGMALMVDARANGEQGTLVFQFIQTASPPAAFTQTARDALEEGSVAIYVGVTIERAGTYEIVGRLYDTTGRPIAYMRFLEELSKDSHEVRLLAFGKVIVDEGAVPPFVLRDVEGARILTGQYPDRELMQTWPGDYTTAKYDLASISSRDYNGADRQDKIQALDHAAEEGLANIKAAASKGGSSGSSGVAAAEPSTEAPPTH